MNWKGYRRPFKRKDTNSKKTKETIAEELKIKAELKATYILLKEYQETINARNSSEKTDQGTTIQRVLGNSDADLQAKIQELQEEEHQCLETKDVSETREKIYEMENLKKQLEAQKSTLENTEWENIKLTQRLHENLVEIRSVTKEIDDLRNTEKTLKVEIDQLKENLRETTTQIQELQEKEHQILKVKNYLSENICIKQSNCRSNERPRIQSWKAQKQRS
ncbi:hypothetical protein Celaphus_00016619 [Cervus elaphus hippelaphus]|uniref:Uncharacterized protein n=1 Tax=Cervus elaphus hippelaphus TaxID=46360 RepID=A0A212C485_CEREH|nr:hypothetical protein Celaphus_00016619 [Cervus elaphus hippelaphus]